MTPGNLYVSPTVTFCSKIGYDSICGAAGGVRGGRVYQAILCPNERKMRHPDAILTGIETNWPGDMILP